MDYELFHDESQEEGYWHGMLLVPVQMKNILFSYLQTIREHTKHSDPIGIKNIKARNNIYDCADAFIQVGIASLITQHRWKYPVYLGNNEHRRESMRRGKRRYTYFTETIGAKFILFCERDKLSLMKYFPDYGSKIEITFRMGLKGGLHFLGSKSSPINIVKLHFDNHEHLRRNISRERIVDRIGALREYCSISNNSDLIDDRSGNHTRDNCQEYIDCQLLQLTDLMIGGFRSSLGRSTSKLHNEVSRPIKQIIERYIKGYVRMRFSRWLKSICMSQCYIENEKWHFEELDIQYKGQPLQLKFPI